MDLNLWLTSSNNTKKKSRTRQLHGWCYQTFREELIPVLLELFSKEKFRVRNAHKVILGGSHYADITGRQRYYKIEIYDSYHWWTMMQKILKKILANRIQQHIKRMCWHCDQLEFIPGMPRFFSMCKLNTMVHYTNNLRNKNHMVIIMDAEKAFDKIQHPLMTNALERVGTEGTSLNIIKAIYDKSSAHISLYGERLKVFSKIKKKTKMYFGSHSHGHQKKKK